MANLLPTITDESTGCDAVHRRLSEQIVKFNAMADTTPYMGAVLRGIAIELEYVRDGKRRDTGDDIDGTIVTMPRLPG